MMKSKSQLPRNVLRFGLNPAIYHLKDTSPTIVYKEFLYIFQISHIHQIKATFAQAGNGNENK